MIHALVAASVITACSYDSTQPYGTPPGGQGSPPPDTTSALEGLWTSSGSGPALLRLSAAQLTGHRNIVAASTITTASASLGTLNSIAFDDAGTMWVASENDDRLLAFGADRLGATGLSIATFVLAPIDSSLAGPSSIAFDRQHRLWVANAARGTIVRFDASQLAAGGQPVPAVTIEGIGHPASIAFDADGALWMSDNLTNRLFKFGAAKIAASGGPAPDVVITAGTAFSLKSPQGIAFDADGKLWVANPGRGNLVAYDAAQQATGGPLVPSVSIALAPTDANTPVGLAFDSTRALWVVSADGSLAKLDRASLAGSGQPAASVTLRVEQRSLLWSVAMWPKVTGLPLN
jgi:sugar lactone lactonase YvrE